MVILADLHVVSLDLSSEFRSAGGLVVRKIDVRSFDTILTLCDPYHSELVCIVEIGPELNFGLLICFYVKILEIPRDRILTTTPEGLKLNFRMTGRKSSLKSQKALPTSLFFHSKDYVKKKTKMQSSE